MVARHNGVDGTRHRLDTGCGCRIESEVRGTGGAGVDGAAGASRACSVAFGTI